MAGSCFTSSYEGLSRVLRNNVNIRASGDASGNVQPAWMALWDTGATSSVITKKVVESLELKPVSIQKARTPQGVYEAFCYYVDLLLPNRVIINKLLVMEGQPAECDILVGMDVITKGDFAVTHFGGRTVFSFRVPTMATLDFVKQSYLQPYKDSSSTPGRNSICPCGSGRKYKQCCGKI